MMNKNLETKIINATKWSAITEVVAKLISPVTNMILARLLSPEAFGVIATVTMITSFSTMLSDAGFQKYIVQHEFKNEEEERSSLNVAFWSNFTISLGLWLVIALFRNQLAEMVGNPGLGNVFTIASSTILLTAFSSMQMAYYRRRFEFKILFKVRLIGSIIPLVVTVPLAILCRNYWALVVGNIASSIANAVILTWYSSWKPKFEFRFQLLKSMFSFSWWSLIEQITIWLGDYIGIFIVGKYLSSYDLGIYKTSMTMVNQIMTLITSATTPVLFAGLSRVQHKDKEFQTLFFTFQRYVGLIVLPMSIGIYAYRELVTNILMGGQWDKAIEFVGLWGAMSGIKIVFSNYCSEVYRAQGRPKLSVLTQTIYLIILIPGLILSAHKGFEAVCEFRAYSILVIIGINLFVLTIFTKISFNKLVKNEMIYLMLSLLIIPISEVLQSIYYGIIWDIFSIIIISLGYFLVIVLIPNTRKDLIIIVSKIFKV